MDRDSAQTSVPKGLQFRVGLLAGLAVVLGAGFVIYALYARGVFEDTQRLTAQFAEPEFPELDAGKCAAAAQRQ